jgi:hypothetical protein
MPSNIRPRDDDAFVNVMFQEEHNGTTLNDSFYDKFVEKGRIFGYHPKPITHCRDISFGSVF